MGTFANDAMLFHCFLLIDQEFFQKFCHLERVPEK
uniref:Uncharacterized protein n=1 Tax=viral metagenome TaxID=1070528 RepID=A0A6C0BNJ3_9ZZZZ